MELPHLTDELGRAPTCILALMILNFNVFVSLSILDYAELLTINGKTAEEKLERYEKWLRETTGRESEHPPFAHPLLRAMRAPFLLYMARFLLSYASPIWTADARLPQKTELTLIILPSRSSTRSWRPPCRRYCLPSPISMRKAEGNAYPEMP